MLLCYLHMTINSNNLLKKINNFLNFLDKHSYNYCVEIMSSSFNGELSQV